MTTNQQPRMATDRATTAHLEAQLQAEMRLHVLESLVALLFATMHRATPDPAATLDVLRKALIEAAGKAYSGDHGAAACDLINRYQTQAIDAAINMQRAWVGLPAAMSQPDRV